MMATDTTLLARAAAKYAREHLAIFACEPHGKAPFGPLAPQGYHNASADPDLVAEWWRAYPECNIGLPCAPNNLLILDVDPRNAEGDPLEGLELPVTPTADTGGGGVHYLFAAPEGWEPTGKAGDGLDIKFNGYIVVPPSVHPSGGVYTWRPGLRPWEVPAAPVPEWLELCIKPRPVTTPSAPARPPADDADHLPNEEVARLALALLATDRADDYEEWVQVGMALHSVSDELLPEWDAWSRQSGKYQPGLCERKWRGFKPDHGVTLASLVVKARQDGDADFLMPGWRRRTMAPESSNGHAKASRPPTSPNPSPPDEFCRPGLYRRDDIGNAERFVDLQGDRYRYCFDWKTWLAYDGRRWASDTSEQALAAARTVARSMLLEAAAEPEEFRAATAKHAAMSSSRSRLEAMLFLARPDLAVISTQLDVDPWLMCCPNGVVDLRTGELRPHQPDDLLHRMTASPYVPDADLADTDGARAWRKFLAGATQGDDELASYLQRAAGYTICGDPREEVLLFFYGPTRTGKSTFLETVGHHLADYADQVDFSAFLRKREDSELRPELAKLQGKRFVASSETSAGRSIAEGLVKTITGNELISVAAKYKDPVAWRPAFTLCLAANDRPSIRHEDDALWRRVRVVPFTHQVAETDIDLGLKSKLRDEAGEAVIAWLVRGCLAWQREGLGTCQAVIDATDAYRADMDPLGTFLVDCCRIDPDAEWFTPTGELYRAYLDWCEREGEKKPLSRKRIGEELLRRLGPESKSRRRVEKSLEHGYCFIKLRDESQGDLFDEECSGSDPLAKRGVPGVPGGSGNLPDEISYTRLPAQGGTPGTGGTGGTDDPWDDPFSTDAPLPPVKAPPLADAASEEGQAE